MGPDDLWQMSRGRCRSVTVGVEVSKRCQSECVYRPLDLAAILLGAIGGAECNSAYLPRSIAMGVFKKRLN